MVPHQHLKFTVIPKCAVPLFCGHNGNVKCKADLDNVLYLDRQSREKCFKMLCNCVVLAALGTMC